MGIPANLLIEPASLAPVGALSEFIEPVYVARMVVFHASAAAAMCSANNYMVEAGSI